MVLSPKRQYHLLVVFFLSALFLSAEVWMQAVRHTSFCTTSSCAVVGEYIRFGEGNLIKLGAMFFWLLWALVFFGSRYDKRWIWGLVCLILLGALAFDGALLGFQFVGLEEKCALCIGVASALFVQLGLLAWVRRSVLIFFLGAAVWIGGFTANSVLDLDVTAPVVTETSFLNTAPDGNASAHYPQHVLFFSLHCDHCSKILGNLSINKEHLPETWLFSCIDNKEDDLFRLSHILASSATKENPFLEILRLESLETVEPVLISEDLRRTVREARAYFKMKEFGGIPVLVVVERPGRELILRGENTIMDYLREREFVRRELSFVSPAPEQPLSNSSE